MGCVRYANESLRPFRIGKSTAIDEKRTINSEKNMYYLAKMHASETKIYFVLSIPFE